MAIAIYKCKLFCGIEFWIEIAIYMAIMVAYNHDGCNGDHGCLHTWHMAYLFMAIATNGDCHLQV
jgi:hypothetical protein